MARASATKRACDRRAARAAVCLQHVAVEVNGPFARAPRSPRSPRKERPIRRWISTVRPSWRPRVASRCLRSPVEAGSIPYSAVTQPRPLPAIHRGTLSWAEAVQITRVSPIEISAEPVAVRTKPGSISYGAQLTGRAAVAALLWLRARHASHHSRALRSGDYVRALVVSNMLADAAHPERGRFVRDQVAALRRLDGVDVELFEFAPGKGELLKAGPRPRAPFRREPWAGRFDIVHAHFGLTAWPALAVAGAARALTLHGTDLTHPLTRRATLAVLGRIDLLAAVSAALLEQLPPQAAARGLVLPCGVDLERFQPSPRQQARAEPRAGPWPPLPAVPRRPRPPREAPRPGGGTRRRQRSGAADPRRRRPRPRAALDQCRQCRAGAFRPRGLRAGGARGAGLRRSRARDPSRHPSAGPERRRWRALRAIRPQHSGSPSCGHISMQRTLG